MESPVEVKKVGEDWKIRVWFDEGGKPFIIQLRVGSLRYFISRIDVVTDEVKWVVSEENYWTEVVNNLDELLDLIESSSTVTIPRTTLKILLTILTWDYSGDEDLVTQIKSILREEVE